MKKPINDLIESSSQEALLTAYQDIHKGFSWRAELSGLLDGNGKMNIAALALKGLAQNIAPDGEAFITVDTSEGTIRSSAIRRAELEKSVRKLAGGFQAVLGIKKGDAVAIFLPNSLEMAQSVLALAYIGALAAPIIDIYRADPVRNRLTNLKPKSLITSSEMMENLDESDFPFMKNIILTDGGGKGKSFQSLMEHPEAAPEMVAPSHPFIIHYTSGTFGIPKGILHSHASAAGYFRTAQWVFGLQPGKRLWCTAHPGWLPGSAYGIFGALLSGASSILCAGKPEFGVITELKPTAIYTIPSTIARLASAGENAGMPSVEVLATTGERLSPSVMAQVKERYGRQILDTWCMTETGMIMVSNFPFAPVKIGSVGLPVPGITAMVVNENNVPLPSNTLGILAFEKNWPSLMSGIWGDGKEVDEAFTSKNFITTDYAYMDEDGYLWVQGRGEEFIKRGSERISPYEIEDVLLGHPGVCEIAAIPVTRDGKEKIKLFVVLSSGFEEGEEIVESMKSHVRENMGAYAVPDEISFLEELPKTRTGKVLRRSLKAKEMNLPEEQ